MFWLLVALVVVPTLALAGYGLTGLKYASDAAASRLRDRYLLQSRLLEQEVLLRLQEEDGWVREEVRRGKSPADLERAGRLVEEAWYLPSDDAPAPVQDASSRLAPGERLTFGSVDVGQGPWLVAFSTLGPGQVVAWRVSPARLDALALPAIVDRLFPGETAVYHLEMAVPGSSGQPVTIDSIRREMASRLEAEPEVDRAMEAPFEHWRIVVRGVEDPVAGGWRSVTVVVVLAAMVVAGVTLMGRAIAQQVRLARLQTDFVSAVSHELRTPLTSIRMFVETLQSGRVQDPERIQECLGIIADETERLSRKIERVLGWARLESGRRAYAMEPARPRAVVERALHAWRTQQMGERPDEVAVDVPHDLPLIEVDPEAMEEVLLNLLGNARKYGGPNVRIEGRADRTHVYLTVADDGPGIPPDERRRIFEKFYRPDILQTRKVAGTGLGLAIVQAIVAAHRGKVEVASEPGMGTRFTVRLSRA